MIQLRKIQPEEMSESETLPAGRGRAGGPMRLFLASEGWAMGFILTATLVVELGCFFVCLSGGAGFDMSLIATLGIMSLWTVISSGPLAWWGRGNFLALLRGGLVADATCISLLIIWLQSPNDSGLSFSGVVKLYCVFTAVTLAGVSAVLCVKRPAARLTVAVIVVGLLFCALASPVWASVHLGGSEPSPEAQQAIANWAVRINPFYAACDAVVFETNFIWHGWGEMYDLTRIGEYVSPVGVRWYQTVFLYLAAAIFFGIIALLRSRGRGRESFCLHSR